MNTKEKQPTRYPLVAFRLSYNEDKRLIEYAQRTNQSKSAVVKTLLRNFFKENAKATR